MEHKVINQYSRYLNGRERDLVIDAVMRDADHVVIDGIRVEIVSHTVFQNGEKVTRVKV